MVIVWLFGGGASYGSSRSGSGTTTDGGRDTAAIKVITIVNILVVLVFVVVFGRRARDFHLDGFIELSERVVQSQ